jgi:hypothetical protein
MNTCQASRCASHCVDIQQSSNVPSTISDHWTPELTVINQVHVGPGSGGTLRVKGLINLNNIANYQIPRNIGIERNLCLLCGKPPTDIRMDYLSRSMNSFVSSTGSVNPNPCPCQTTKCHFQLTLNRSHIRSLELIALKSGTVILN